jgi:hypothetical protein
MNSIYEVETDSAIGKTTNSEPLFIPKQQPCIRSAFAGVDIDQAPPDGWYT